MKNPPMVLFRVRDDFPAAHRIRIDTRGTREPIHVHHWRVDVLLRGSEPIEPAAARALDTVREWVARYRGRSLHRTAPYDRINPTAEEVARALCEELAEELTELRVIRVTIGEAAGFSATYWPEAVDRDRFSASP